MSTEANHHCNNVGKVAAYTVYNLGVGVVVGLVRTIIAIMYIAKHAFYAKSYELAHKQAAYRRRNEHAHKGEQRTHEVRNAERNTKSAKGFVDTAKAKFSEIGTKAKHTVGGFVDDLTHEIKETTQEAVNEGVQELAHVRQEAWKGQLCRGILELCVVGAPYYTYQDNFSKDHKVSALGFGQLKQLIQDERDLDDKIEQLVGKKHYNPCF